MLNSKNKMNVVVTKNMPWGNSKEWVRVTMLYSRTWIPSFADLFRIIKAICECEDRKYPNGQGREMVADFLEDAVYEDNFERLAERYEIPDRNTNG